jgi:hypothetical protein
MASPVARGIGQGDGGGTAPPRSSVAARSILRRLHRGFPVVSCHGRAYGSGVGVEWTESERREIADGIRKYDIRSGMCAALARIVHRVAKTGARDARGLQLRCKKAVRFLVPRKPHIPHWGSHTYVETGEHAVDAVTGPEGYEAASYVNDHWHWNEKFYEQIEVDVAAVDPGIEDSGDGS